MTTQSLGAKTTSTVSTPTAVPIQKQDTPKHGKNTSITIQCECKVVYVVTGYITVIARIGRSSSLY